MCCLKEGSRVGLVFVGVFYLLQGAATSQKSDVTRRRRGIDYCHPPPPMCQVFNPNETVTHVMCKYPSPGPSDRCDRYKSKPMDGTTRSNILRRHNAMRNRVAMGLALPQPASSNMCQLSWNDELARFAQRWVEQCVTLSESPHDQCRDTPASWVGQNVGVIEHDGQYDHYEEVDELVVDFYNEIKKFDGKAVRKFDADPLVVGHYAQLVWAETTMVGCARASYNVMTGKGERRHTRLVCNYAPAGLITNEPVYMVGMPCSNCPNDTSCSNVYPALCSTDQQKVESKNGAKSYTDVTARSDGGIRFVVGTFVNGRCYCRGGMSQRRSPFVWWSMIAILVLSQMYYREM